MKRAWMALALPKRSAGSAFHGHPVRSTKTMASNTRRALLACAPPRSGEHTPCLQGAGAAAPGARLAAKIRPSLPRSSLWSFVASKIVLDAGNSFYLRISTESFPCGAFDLRQLERMLELDTWALITVVVAPWRSEIHLPWGFPDNRLDQRTGVAMKRLQAMKLR